MPDINLFIKTNKLRQELLPSYPWTYLFIYDLSFEFVCSLDKITLSMQVFQKGSPIVKDVSQAILTLSENGRLEQLETKWFTPSQKCLNSQTPDKIDSLSWQSFWGLYLFSAFISTIFYLLFATHQSYKGDITLIYRTMLYKLAGLVKYFHIIVRKLQGTTPNTVQALGVYECNTSSIEYTSSSETLEQSQAPTSI